MNSMAELKEEFKADFRFKRKDYAVAAYRALTPEARRPPTGRHTMNLRLKGKILTLRIQAGDLAALRAAVNAYLRYLSAWYEVIAALSP